MRKIDKAIIIIQVITLGICIINLIKLILG